VTLYRVQHKTQYEYESPVLHSHHALHLRPRNFVFQTVQRSLLNVEPRPHVRHAHKDYFGNETEYLELLTAHDCLDVVAVSEVEVGPRFEALSQVDQGTPWENVVQHLSAQLPPRQSEYCLDSPLVRRHAMLRAYAEPSFGPQRSLVEAVSELNQRIFTDFKYETAATDVTTPLAQVMRQRRGVCQDFAHVAIGCLRSMGLAARYVSGYMETLPPPGQPRLIGADASHAWASAWLPGFGWLDLDPTNSIFPNGRHISVALGRDFSDVSPLSGVVLGGGRHQLSVSVDVAVAPN
jgi:transglutaminase-like putative cysteine protease